jgi:hypothetical protein
MKLNDRVIELFKDPATVKVLVTVDALGVPHAVVKQSFHLGEDGKLYYLEQLESSRSNANMVRSIWYDATVSVLLIGPGARAVQIKGKPVKAHITGAFFQEHYERLRAERPEADLAAVWVIEPEIVIDENPAVRRKEEAKKHPHFVHLDRLAKKADAPIPEESPVQ